MAFTLGNFNIDEILYGVAEHDGVIAYTMDQLSSASIEISSDGTDITDKRGNIVRTVYKTKTGTFTATNAFLHPQIMNAASGASIETATSDAKIDMPKIEVIAAGTAVKSYELDSAVKDETVQVVGLMGSGANVILTKNTSAPTNPAVGEFGYDASSNKVYVPAGGTDAPVRYLIKYDREATDGIKLTNSANEFPSTVKMTLFCSYVDPCDDDLKPAYIVLPSFQPSPETTISLSADDQEMDYTGNLQIDYCSADQALYYIYFPADGKVVTGNAA